MTQGRINLSLGRASANAPQSSHQGCISFTRGVSWVVLLTLYDCFPPLCLYSFLQVYLQLVRQCVVICRLTWRPGLLRELHPSISPLISMWCSALCQPLCPAAVDSWCAPGSAQALTSRPMLARCAGGECRRGGLHDRVLPAQRGAVGLHPRYVRFSQASRAQKVFASASCHVHRVTEPAHLAKHDNFWGSAALLGSTKRLCWHLLMPGLLALPLRYGDHDDGQV